MGNKPGNKELTEEEKDAIRAKVKEDAFVVGDDGRMKREGKFGQDLQEAQDQKREAYRATDDWQKGDLLEGISKAAQQKATAQTRSFSTMIKNLLKGASAGNPESGVSAPSTPTKEKGAGRSSGMGGK